MGDPTDLEAALNRLFATPPEDFVAARNALAKALRAEKRKDEAGEVAALRKPNRLVWALDQLALEDDPVLGPLLDAVELVRDGGGDDLKEAIADLREAVTAAAAAAARRLDPPRLSDRADLATAINAVVADEDGADELARGRLLEVPAPDAFGLGPTHPTTATKAEPRRSKPKPPRTAATKGSPPPDQLAIRRAAKRRQAAAKEADAAQRALARAEQAVEGAAAALTEAAEAVDAATAAVTEAEAARRQAQEDLQAAERLAAEAVDEQERVAAALAEAHERASAAEAELDEATAEEDALGG